MEHFLHQAFSYAKMAIGFLYYLANVRAAVYFGIYCLIVWVVSRNPIYRGDKSKIMKILSHEQFYFMIGSFDQKVIEQGNNAPVKATAKKPQKDYSKIQHTLVIFNAPWSDSCYFTFPMWAKFAIRFTTPKLNFIEVDVSRFESLAKLYKVNTSGFGNLPALILFEDGREVLRFPLATDDKKAREYNAGNISSYKDKDLIKYFDLDKRYLATRDTSSPLVTGGV